MYAMSVLLAVLMRYYTSVLTLDGGAVAMDAEPLSPMSPMSPPRSPNRRSVREQPAASTTRSLLEAASEVRERPPRPRDACDAHARTFATAHARQTPTRHTPTRQAPTREDARALSGPKYTL